MEIMLVNEIRKEIEKTDEELIYGNSLHHHFYMMLENSRNSQTGLCWHFRHFFFLPCTAETTFILIRNYSFYLW